MPEPALHLDADTSSKALYQVLLERGHDVTRTLNEWMRCEASDERQLLGATSHGRCIFTFHIRDFIVLAQNYPRNADIVLAAQSSWKLAELIVALDRLLSEMDADDWIGQEYWLNDWR